MGNNQLENAGESGEVGLSVPGASLSGFDIQPVASDEDLTIYGLDVDDDL